MLMLLFIDDGFRRVGRFRATEPVRRQTAVFKNFHAAVTGPARW